MLTPYPQIVEYNEAVQNPATAFRDPELRQGQVKLNALGLPVALSGGFALTYMMATRRRRLAVRCFHREIPKAQHKYAAKKSVADYFRSNFVLTTSGNFSTSALNQSIEEIGAARVLWSADYPFEDISDAAEWIDAAPLSDEDRLKIGRTNAQKLFRLKK